MKQSKDHITHMATLIDVLFDLFVDDKTAKNEIPKKRTSIVFHQIGVSAQQVEEHVFAIKRKGVTKQ